MARSASKIKAAAELPVEAKGWSKLVLETERLGQQAVAKAISEHKVAGRSIYYSDPAYPGCVIRELADGQRCLITEDADGHEVRVREIPPR